MNENDNLKFNPITHGNMNMNDNMRNYIKEQQVIMESRAKKLEGMRVAKVDNSRRNDVSTKKKANKALKVAIATVLIYSMAVGIVSTRKVDIEHNVSYEASGSSLVTTSEEDISFKEYADEFVHNLNPVNLIDSSREVRKSR